MEKDLIPHDLVEEGAVITVEAPDALVNNHKKALQADVSYVTPVTNGTTEVKKAKAKIEVTCFNAKGTEISYNTPVNAGEEITYIATIKGEEDKKKLEDLKKSLKWMFWVGDKTLPKSQKYIAIARNKAGTESKTDIMQEKDPGKLYASLQQYGYISSSWGKGNQSKEDKNSTCELKIVFSKWFDTFERVRVEAYIGTPERTSNSSAVCSREVKAANGGVTFDELWSNYPSCSIVHTGSSGEDIFSDHCAIDMSEALMKSGINLSGGVRCWGNCPSGGAHFIRAQELANALNGRYNVTRLTDSNFYDQIKGKQGIIFFQDYWQRAGEPGRTGDHIDLWNGSYLKSNGWMLTRLRLNLPNMMEGFGSSSLYKSKSVYFWEF